MIVILSFAHLKKMYGLWAGSGHNHLSIPVVYADCKLDVVILIQETAPCWLFVELSFALEILHVRKYFFHPTWLIEK